jgi:tetratricopeptide (TPR) repeat protein
MGCLFLAACSRPAQTPEERVAILRFENLGPDASQDWMGRALSELVTGQLTGRPGRYAISSGTLHALSRGTGPRPKAAPGVSAESSLAVLAGANRVGYGEFAVRGGRLEARLFLEDLPARKYVKVVQATGAAMDAIAVADSLARQIAPDAQPAIARSNEAVRDYVNAMEGGAADDIMKDAAAAIAADPGFTPAYRLLAEWKALERDTTSALALLEQAAQRAASPLERARIHLQSAGLRNDAAGRREALAEMANADPGNPDQWGMLGEARLAAHSGAEAAAAFRRQLALDPNNRNAWNLLAYADAGAGDLPAAVEALRRYQAESPQDPNPIDSLGDVHLMTGHLREAEQFYLAAYKKDPKFMDGAELLKAAMARLMTGDASGATQIQERYAQSLTGSPTHAVEIERAEWIWACGRRREAYQRMLEFARAAESNPRREIAARAYAEVAMWSLFLGDRAAAAEMARKALSVPGAQIPAAAQVAKFLAAGPAPEAEWAARAGKFFPPNPALAPLRDLALACALLLEKEYQPASGILRKLYDEGAHPPGEEGIPVLLAWTLLETGHYQEAAPLLRSAPVPPVTGATVFTPFYFPRLYYLRGLAAEKSGKPGEAREAYRLFLQLSGPDPLAWGEEAKAKAGGG